MKKISEQVLFQGRWLAIYEQIYDTKKGERIAWETVRRTKSSAGVVVIAKMVPSERFILIKQFRPAINGYILGFPAGLADGDPQQAVVELKEETGYTGKVIYASPVLKTGSSIIDDNGRIIYLQVDEKLAVNKNPQQHLEPGEDIQVFLVSKAQIGDFLKENHEQGTAISANLWYLFIIKDLL